MGVSGAAGRRADPLPAALHCASGGAGKAAGAKIVVIHGETLVEPVPPGTNRASVECPDVDVLGHPGLLTEAEAALAAENGVFLEITSRRGHCLGNGNTVVLGRAAGAKFLVNSDTHSPGDLHTEAFARTVALGAGLTAGEADAALYENPKALLARVGAETDMMPQAQDT